MTRNSVRAAPGTQHTPDTLRVYTRAPAQPKAIEQKVGGDLSHISIEGR